MVSYTFPSATCRGSTSSGMWASNWAKLAQAISRLQTQLEPGSLPLDMPYELLKKQPCYGEATNKVLPPLQKRAVIKLRHLSLLYVHSLRHTKPCVRPWDAEGPQPQFLPSEFPISGGNQSCPTTIKPHTMGHVSQAGLRCDFHGPQTLFSSSIKKY